MLHPQEHHGSFFRTLLTRALEHAWTHQELWPFAALAGVAGLGSAINDIITQAQLSSVIPESTPFALLENILFFQGLFSHITLSGPLSSVLATLTVLGILLGFSVFLVWSQHIVIRASHHAATSAHHLSVSELMRDAAHPRLISMLVINAFTKITVLNILLFSGILLHYLHPELYIFDAFFGVVFALTSFILAAGVNILGILSLIGLVTEHTTLLESFRMAWSTMKKHPIACIELSVGLYGLTFIISLLAMIGLILIGALGSAILGIGISSSSVSGLAAKELLIVTLGTVWTIALAGFSTLTTYLSWTGFFHLMAFKKKTHSSRSFHHLEKLFTTLLS